MKAEGFVIQDFLRTCHTVIKSKCRKKSLPVQVKKSNIFPFRQILSYVEIYIYGPNFNPLPAINSTCRLSISI